MRMTPRRHHIMSEFYLNGFGSNGYLWVFDMQKQEFRKQPPRHTMVVIDHYTLKLKSGSKDVAVEEFFAFLESHIAPALVRLKKRHRASPEELGLIALLASNLFLRAPATEQRATRGVEDKAAEFASTKCVDDFFTKIGIEMNSGKNGNHPRLPP